MNGYLTVDPLESQFSPGSRVFPQSDKPHWVGAAGQSLVQLPRAGPLTSPGTPYYTYHGNTPNYQLAFQAPTSISQQTVPWVPHSVPHGFPGFPHSAPSLPVLSPPGPNWNALAWMNLQTLLPPSFPPHEDSIHAELFPLLIAHYSSLPASIFMDPWQLLNMLRQRSLQLHSADLEEMPTMFSYAHVVHHGLMPDSQVTSTPATPVVVTRFGVSAPRRTHLYRGSGIPDGLAAIIRAYRIRKAWGHPGVDPDADIPPPRTTSWSHGHCAEMQAIPPVVEWCEYLGLENIYIYSLSVHKSGTQLAAMCSNCRAYVSTRVLKRHPSWKVVDVHSGTFCK